jgi:putative ABC transport system permease protein
LAAILPGVALQQLWGLVGVAETALGAVAAMVVVTALLGMATMVLATLNERRREMAILRSVGASPAHILGLLLAEAALLVAAGAVLGTVLTYGALAVLRPMIDKHYGLYLEIGPPGAADVTALAAILLGGVAAGLFPAWRAYRLSLADGMTVRT